MIEKIEKIEISVLHCYDQHRGVERRISYFICSQSEILWCCEPKHEKNLQFIFCQRLSYQRWLIISDLFWFLKAWGEVLIVIVMMIVIIISGKLLRTSKYEEEISDGHLGINEKELNSMNKHIPGTLSLNCYHYQSALHLPSHFNRFHNILLCKALQALQMSRYWWGFMRYLRDILIRLDMMMKDFSISHLSSQFW